MRIKGSGDFPLKHFDFSTIVQIEPDQVIQTMVRTPKNLSSGRRLQKYLKGRVLFQNKIQ